MLNEKFYSSGFMTIYYSCVIKFGLGSTLFYTIWFNFKDKLIFPSYIDKFLYCFKHLYCF